MILSLFAFVCFTTGRFVLSCLAFCFRGFSVLFSIVITSLGERGAGICASSAFVCLFCTRQFLSLSLPLGVRDCQRLAIVAFPEFFN